MAQAPTSPVRSSPSQTQAMGDSLQAYLVRAARMIGALELASNFMLLGLGILAMVVLALAIDHWCTPMDRWLRYALWVTLMAGTAFWLARRVLPLIRRRVTPEYAARKIEGNLPELKNGLINWFQLAHGDDPVPRGVIATIARHAIGKLRQEDAAVLIDYGRAARLAASLVGLFLFLGIYLAVAPKNGADTIKRLMMPWADIDAPTRVRILEVDPGDAKVTQGNPLLVRVKVRGVHANEAVQLRYDTADGQSTNQSMVIPAQIQGLSYEIQFGKEWGGIQQPMRYWISAGDAQAGPFQIDVQSVPLVVIQEVHYQYPKYMRWQDRTTQLDGRIDALEGTRVTIRAAANQPMKHSHIELDPVLENGRVVRHRSKIELETDNRKIEGGFLARLDDQRNNPTQSTYRIIATNLLGEINHEPVIHPIRVMADVAPEVQWLGNVPNPLKIPVNRTSSLEVRAIDPDFGLTKLSVQLSRSGQQWPEQVLLSSVEGHVGQVNRSVDLSPSAMGLVEGDSFEVVAKASDNRCQLGTDEPAPQTTSSAVIRVQVVTPTKSETKDPKTGPQKDTKSNGKDRQQSRSPSDSGQPASNSNSESDSANPETSDNRPGSQSDQQKGNQDPPNKPDGQSSNQEDASHKNNGSQGLASNAKGQSRGSKSSGGGTSSSSNENSSSPDVEEPGKPGSSANQSNSSRQDSKNAGSRGTGTEESGENQSGSGTQSIRSNQPRTSKGTPGNPQEKQHDGDVFEKVQQFQQEKESSEHQATGEPSGNGATSESRGESSENKSPSGSQGNPQKNPSPSSSPDTARLQPSTDAAQPKQAKQPNSQPSPTQDPGTRQPSSQQANSRPGSTQQSGTQQQGTQQQGTQQQGTQQQGLQQPGSQQQGSQQQGSQQQGSQQQGSQQQGSQQQGSQQQGSEQSGGPRSGTKQPGSHPSDSRQPGSQPAGTQESSSEQSGTQQSGTQQSSDQQSGKDQSSEQRPSGQPQPGNEHSGKEHSGKEHSGKEHSGKEQSGKEQSGKELSGKEQSGQQPAKTQGSSAEASQTGSAEKMPEQSWGTGQQGSSQPNADGGTGGARASKEGGLMEPTHREEAYDAEYARNATNMILDYLRRQREQPDPELLKRLNWTAEDLRAFVDRWEKAREQAAKDPNKQREWDESLRSLGLVPKGAKRNVRTEQDQLRGMQESGRRIRPPTKLGEQLDRYKRSLSQPK